MNKYKNVLKYLGNILAIVSIIFLINILRESYSQIQFDEIDILTLLLLGFILSLWGVITYMLFAYAWVLLLKTKYPSFHFVTSLRIICISQIAKYLPGNVGHYFSRFYLTQRIINKVDTSISVLIETMLFIWSSTVIGLFYLYFYSLSEFIHTKYLITTLFIIIMSIISLIVAFNWLKKKHDISNINLQSILSSLSIYILLPVMGGISLYLIFLFIFSVDNLSFFLCLTAFSISFLLGFIIVGAPGGIGVREYAFTLLMTPFVDSIIALQAIVIFRVISLITDLGIYLWAKYSSPESNHQIPLDSTNHKNISKK